MSSWTAELSEETLLEVVHRKETDRKSSASLWADGEEAAGPSREGKSAEEDDEQNPAAEEGSADAAAQQEEGPHGAEGTSRAAEMDAEAAPEETPETTQLAAASTGPNLDAAEPGGPGQEAECCHSCHAAPPAAEEVVPPAALRCGP